MLVTTSRCWWQHWLPLSPILHLLTWIFQKWNEQESSVTRIRMSPISKWNYFKPFAFRDALQYKYLSEFFQHLWQWSFCTRLHGGFSSDLQLVAVEFDIDLVHSSIWYQLANRALKRLKFENAAWSLIRYRSVISLAEMSRTRILPR